MLCLVIVISYCNYSLKMRYFNQILEKLDQIELRLIIDINYLFEHNMDIDIKRDAVICDILVGIIQLLLFKNFFFILCSYHQF